MLGCTYASTVLGHFLFDVMMAVLFNRPWRHACAGGAGGPSARRLTAGRADRPDFGHEMFAVILAFGLAVAVALAVGLLCVMQILSVLACAAWGGGACGAEWH
jgi:hypothetical protein